MKQSWFPAAKEQAKGVAVTLLMNLLSPVRGIPVFYNDPGKRQIYDLICAIKNSRHVLMWPNEGYQLYTAVRATQKIAGDIAEVGVYQGGSAKIICEVKGSKPLHLFDTFAGLPAPSDSEKQELHEGQFKAGLKDVQRYLKSYPNVFYYKGIFPTTSGPVKRKKFSFVNLDVDLYQGTHDALMFFYPRLTPGGIIMSHNYSNLSGVKRAFDEFFASKKEPIIELSASQCLVVKV